ncbi:hypothetical protein A0J61_01293 [Choanephora cucurbitarum]|uniref:Uncharacterized protein n=1 Tax=Choanephora cucurbitarum TaxID=101091 RepID=A0A1C7NNW0_9FUNG|nr:hypothetical protein A0J61_01293 [Choanephora cucurbitarum]
MPNVNRFTSADDIIPASAFTVSPILTSNLLDEIDSAVARDTSNFSHSTTPPAPPPSTRWSRRLTSSNLHCLSEKAFDTSSLLKENEEAHDILDFEIMCNDGGRFGEMYGIENVLLNDGSVYCSGRKGTVNILVRYCGFIQSGLIADTNCSITKMVLKAPQHGFSAPCKEGLVFISHREINIQDTSKFDHFSKAEYEQYRLSNNQDTDPVAWFSLSKERTCIVDLEARSAKYVLIKLLRAETESDNIDIQYIGFIGFSGARSFSSAKLC